MHSNDVDETQTAEAGHVPFLTVQRPGDLWFLYAFRAGDDGVWHPEWRETQEDAKVFGPSRAEWVVEHLGPQGDSGMFCRIVQKTCDMIVNGGETVCRLPAVAVSNDGVAMCRSCALAMAAEKDDQIYVASWSGDRS